jgi:putative PEP-CTERM system histidine kinase
VSQNAFATVSLWSYGLALAGYVLFAIRVSLGSRRHVRARLLVVALAMTALWGALSLPLALAPSAGSALLASISEALRYGAWLVFLWHLLSPPNEQGKLTPGTRKAFVAVAAALVASVLLGEGLAAAGLSGAGGLRAGFLLRIGLAVFALMLVEQVVRRVPVQMRWSIKPLAVALGGMFGLDLYLYADAMLFGQLDPDIWASRGFASVIVIPFLAVATARNTGWTVDLHLSRRVVFHSSALLVSGAFLLLVAGAGYFVRYFGGSWGRALQIELLFAAALSTVLVGSSGRFRAKLKVFISKHFFSYRYDYREEWLRFTRTLSLENQVQSIQERTIMALSDLVESPGGALWLKEESRGHVATARWNMPAIDASERTDGLLASFLERTGWVVDIPELHADPARYAGLALPAWVEALASAWLIVPLATGQELIGFVLLTSPRTAINVDWEVRDLLKTASRQAASYLAHVRTSEALLEARKFDAFNRMSAFVVHDLKNLVAQLSLMLKNAQRHRDNPEFQSDMLLTVQHVVGRMNALMLQLRTGAEPAESKRLVDLDAVVRRVCAAKSDQQMRIELVSTAPAAAIGHEQRLEHVIGHLVQNAIDASQKGSSIDVHVEKADRFVTVTVADYGTGMTAEFVRDRLFKPFHTTKHSGMGIGVYESAQYVNGLGGEMSVDSRPGAGTRVRVRIPAGEPAAGAVAIDERVA